MKEKLNKVLNVLIVLALITIIGIIITKIFYKDNGLEKYQKGMEFYNNKDYQNAYYNFVRIPKNSKYYYISLFKQGMCAENLSDNETQAQKYQEYTQKSDNFLTAEAAFKSGVAYYNDEQFQNAEKMFKKSIKSPMSADNDNSIYAIASRYYLGKLEKYPQAAIKYYLEYLKQVQKGKYSKQSTLEILSLLKDNPEISLKEDENLIIAQNLYDYGFYTNAATFLEKTNIEQSWYLKAENNIKINKQTEALENLQEGLTHYYKNIDNEKLSNAINLFVKLYSTDAKEGWQTLANTFEKTDFPALDEILYNLDEFQKIHMLNLKGEYAQKAISELFFRAYEKKDYNLVRTYGTNFMQRFPQSAYAPKILYYLGNAYEYLSKKTEALQCYNRLIVNYQDTFWAFRAYTKLKQKKSSFAKWMDLGYSKIDIPDRQPEFPNDLLQISKNDAVLLNDLIKLEDYNLIEKMAPKNLALKSWTNFKLGNYSLSVVNARDYLNSLEIKPDFQSTLYTLAYPLLYKQEINKNIETTNLNGFLIEALIREESYFNPKAKSSAGAIGLMQLMPATASFVANTQVSESKLYDPEYNIYLGTRYFAQIRNTLHNNNVYAVLAYNGGPGAVQNWLKKYENLNIDEFIENIPYDETQYYIFKIYRSYWNYINIYKPDKL